MSGPLLVLNIPGLVVMLASWTIATLLLFRGFQIVRRKDYRRYVLAIAYIGTGIVSAFIALSIIYLVGFGLGYRLI